MSEARSHLSIGEVLSLLQDEFPDVTISKIRFLESQGLLDPERTPSGYRKFYDDDIARLRWILAQQRDHFLPLRVIKERLAGKLAREESVTEAAAPKDEPAARPPVADRAALAEALARRAAERASAPDESPAEATAETAASNSTPARTSSTEVSMTVAELAAAAGLTERDVATLESYGLLAGHSLGREIVYDGDSLVVARLAARFLAHGIEARHLRMFKLAAEREAAVYEQLVTPVLRQRNPEVRARVGTQLDELGRLGNDLRAALLQRTLRSITGG